MLKDQTNKKEHEQSAQLACEAAAAAIRTVVSYDPHSKSLEGPLQRSNRTAIWSNMLYAISQAVSFFVIALVFWYGSRLVSFLEYSIFQFFVGLMVSPHSITLTSF